MPVTAKTLDGGTAAIAQAEITDLAANLSGELLVAGDAGFEESRTIWNGMIDRQPAFVVRCRGAADVIASVNFARERNLTLTIKGGGHNIAGLSVADGAVMLDMSLMRGVWVDPSARLARAEAGCLLGNLDRETQVHGLAAVIGFVSNTGIAGLTLGGGFGYMTRKHGWTTDNVTAMEMVTADGQFVRASDEENSDLFWGLRGGGGNFGVMTGFEYKLYPVGPEVMAGVIAWPLEDAAGVMKLFHEITSEAPPELTCVAVLRDAPVAPWLPENIHGKPIVALLVLYTGSVDEGQKLVAPIKAFGSPVGDVLQPRSYLSQQSLLDATQPKGRRYYWKSEYLRGLDPELLGKTVDQAKNIPSPHGAILLFPLDGALNELPEDHSAVGNRDARFVVNITAAWDNLADDDVNIGWAREAWRDMKKFSTGGTYINFLTEEEGEDRIQSAYKGNLQRLVDIKTRWDPNNMFRTNKNIAPQ